MAPAPAPRIAVVVDWLAQFGGAELVIQQILAAYPGADLFALFDEGVPVAALGTTAQPFRALEAAGLAREDGSEFGH